MRKEKCTVYVCTMSRGRKGRGAAKERERERNERKEGLVDEETKELRNGRGVSISKVVDDSIEEDWQWKAGRARATNGNKGHSPPFGVGVLTRGRATWYPLPAESWLLERTARGATRCGAAYRGRRNTDIVAFGFVCIRELAAWSLVAAALPTITTGRSATYRVRVRTERERERERESS